jgi:hypothetical protein
LFAAQGWVGERAHSRCDDLGDLAWCEAPAFRGMYSREVGVDAEAGRAGVDRWKRRDDLDLVAFEPDLFLCLAQRGLEQRRVAGLVLAAGEAELVCVSTERAADDEHEP